MMLQKTPLLRKEGQGVVDECGPRVVDYIFTFTLLPPTFTITISPRWMLVVTVACPSFTFAEPKTLPSAV